MDINFNIKKIELEDIKNIEYNLIEENNYILYIHESPSNKYYIGITRQGINRRWRIDGSGYLKNPNFYKAIQKYGWDNINHYILKSKLNKEEAEFLEKYLIKRMRELSYKLYNVLEGGNTGFKNTKLSEEHKKKISESHKGGKYYPLTKEGKEKLIESLKGNKRALGYKHTEETKLKLSNANKNMKRNPLSNETKEKIRNKRLGFKHTQESKDKISLALKGRKPSQKCIDKLIEYNKNRETPLNLLNKISKKVYQYDLEMNFIKSFPSASEAGRVYGYDNSGISKCCKGKIKTAYGFIWKYENIQD